MHSHQSVSPPRRRSRTLFTLLIAVLIGAGIVTAPHGAEPRAEAAVVGRMLAIGGWEIGAFLSSTGHYVYCIEPGATDPTGNQQAPRRVSSLPGYSGSTFDPTGWSGPVTSSALSGDKLRQINYVLTRHGNTTDASTAVAVQLAIWILRADPGAQGWLDHHVTWLRNHGGGGYIDQANAMAQNARSAAAPVRPQPAQPTITQHESNGTHDHTGTVHYPAGTTSLKISGARFADESTELVITDRSAGSVEWRATVFEDAWAGKHPVEIVSTWQLDSTGWPAEVMLHPPAVPGQQRLASAAGQITTTFRGEQQARAEVDAQFSPVLGTQVRERFLGAESGEFADIVNLSVAEESLPWPSRVVPVSGDGETTEYAPIVATGTVYGPFDSPQPVSAEIPEEAPEAGSAELVALQGPGEYEVVAEDVPRGPGYYYWVWRIRETEQHEELRNGQLLPEGYEFADAFGLVEEGHVVPTALRWSTELLSRTLELDDLVLNDSLTARAEGDVWLKDDEGERIPARIRLTVFESDEQPARSSEVPANAREVARAVVQVVEPDTAVRAEPIQLPDSTRGWVSVQACLFDEDQPEQWRGYFEEWCDDYGIPAETAFISVPELSQTGAGSGPLLSGAPFIGIGLAYTGVSALLIGGLFRQRRRARSKHAANANQIHRL